MVFRRFHLRFLIPDAIPLQDDAAWRDLYDQLDQQRIAIYPIDARGLMLADNNLALILANQHLAMDDVSRSNRRESLLQQQWLERDHRASS